MLSKAPPVPQLQLSSPSQASKEHEHEHFQNDGNKIMHGRFHRNFNVSGDFITGEIFNIKREIGLLSMNVAPKPMITKKTEFFRIFICSSILAGLYLILFSSLVIPRVMN
ncbi:hypothetical protein GBA52_023142 [Prunus armeniaca]|nr:hypothetical protein GBA52_023142 [Prunus armeniaca]